MMQEVPQVTPDGCSALKQAQSEGLRLRLVDQMLEA